jgi:hypothetical protein
MTGNFTVHPGKVNQQKYFRDRLSSVTGVRQLPEPQPAADVVLRTSLQSGGLRSLPGLLTQDCYRANSVEFLTKLPYFFGAIVMLAEFGRG